MGVGLVNSCAFFLYIYMSEPVLSEYPHALLNYTPSIRWSCFHLPFYNQPQVMKASVIAGAREVSEYDKEEHILWMIGSVENLSQSCHQVM